jgi:hypothetical protein
MENCPTKRARAMSFPPAGCAFQALYCACQSGCGCGGGWAMGIARWIIVIREVIRLNRWHARDSPLRRPR